MCACVFVCYHVFKICFFRYSSGEGSSTGQSRSMVLQGAAGSSLRSSSFIGSTMDKELLSQSLPGSSCKESSGLSSYTREKKDVEGYSSKHLEPEYISEAGSVLGENECMSASLTGGDLELNTYTDNVDLSLDVVKSPQYKYIPRFVKMVTIHAHVLKCCLLTPLVLSSCHQILE